MKEKIIFKIFSKNDMFFIELRRNDKKRYKTFKEWWKHKYTATCGEISVTDSCMLYTICKLALLIQEDRVKYYKELEDRGLRK